MDTNELLNNAPATHRFSNCKRWQILKGAAAVAFQHTDLGKNDEAGRISDCVRGA